MWRTFELRILKAAWGIKVDLTAWSVELPEPPEGTLRAGERTWLEVSQVDLRPIDVAQLLYGLSAVAPAIEARHPGHILVDVVGVDYPDTEYQPEAIAVAIIGWAAEEFTFTPPSISVDYDRQANRYVFSA